MDEAADAAAELVARGKSAWKRDRLLRLAGEAIVGRVADAANRLPEEVKETIPDVPWDDVRDIRIVVDHIYHRIDYEALWQTLRADVPHLRERLREWVRAAGQ
ncbi:MAG: HepT-like ribonuclease domain-containing protein [Actinomycetota bacterium]